jgi:predicted SAM-dependent methyltransferase
MKNQAIIGAGDQRWEGWIATQQDELDLLKPETFQKFFGDERAEKLLCEHTWEHLTIEEGVFAAQTCRRFLQPGGRLRVAVPDGLFPNPEYQHMVQVGGPGPADHPAAGHRVVYVAETFAGVFEKAGFEVTLLEWWDTSGVFNRTDWNIEDGPIYRSSLMDHRNEAYRNGQGPLGVSSLILDAIAPSTR